MLIFWQVFADDGSIPADENGIKQACSIHQQEQTAERKSKIRPQPFERYKRSKFSYCSINTRKDNIRKTTVLMTADYECVIITNVVAISYITRKGKETVSNVE